METLAVKLRYCCELELVAHNCGVWRMSRTKTIRGKKKHYTRTIRGLYAGMQKSTHFNSFALFLQYSRSFWRTKCMEYDRNMHGIRLEYAWDIMESRAQQPTNFRTRMGTGAQMALARPRNHTRTIRESPLWGTIEKHNKKLRAVGRWLSGIVRWLSWLRTLTLKTSTFHAPLPLWLKT